MILITGGAGYIGSHVNCMLSERGHETIVIDSLVCGHREFAQWGHFIEGDLNDRELVGRVFKRFSIKAIMHFAAFAYVGESVTSPQKYYDNNVRNALNLLDLMLEHDVPYVVFSSTCATYGNPVRIPITEDHPQYPINPYGRTKLIIENMLGDYSAAYGLTYASLRYFNAAGADPLTRIGEWHEPETHLIPLVLDAALGVRKYVSVFGTDYETRDGTCIRDYIHVTDLADAHVRALDYLMKKGQSDAFNLGNGNGFSVKEVIEVARQVTMKDIHFVEEARRQGDPAILVGSSEKAVRLLGWRPEYHDLSAIVQTAWEWHKVLNRKREMR
jgi:UDP-glucose 4-epimerase